MHVHHIEMMFTTARMLSNGCGPCIAAKTCRVSGGLLTTFEQQFRRYVLHYYVWYIGLAFCMRQWSAKGQYRGVSGCAALSIMQRITRIA